MQNNHVFASGCPHIPHLSQNLNHTHTHTPLPVCVSDNSSEICYQVESDQVTGQAGVSAELTMLPHPSASQNVSQTSAQSPSFPQLTTAAVASASSTSTTPCHPTVGDVLKKESSVDTERECEKLRGEEEKEKGGLLIPKKPIKYLVMI